MLTNENNLAVIKAVKGNSPACLWLVVIYQQQICLIMTQILYALLGKAQYMPISKRSLSAGFRQSETNLGTGRIGTGYHTSGELYRQGRPTDKQTHNGYDQGPGGQRDLVQCRIANIQARAAKRRGRNRKIQVTGDNQPAKQLLRGKALTQTRGSCRTRRFHAKPTTL